MIRQIEFQDYRNMETCAVEFTEGVNVLCGMNAQGKSNILEGIYYFARGRSFRGAHDKELIRFGCPYAKMRLDMLREGYQYPTVLEAYLPKTGRKVFHKNGAQLSSVVEMMGNLRAVLFCPAHLSMVTGGPLERRTFLDIAIAQLSPLYLTHVRRYAKLLAERNALLKLAAGGHPVTDAEWEVYAEGLSIHGAEIAAFRKEYVSLLAESAAVYFAGMTGGAEVPGVIYQSHALTEEDDAPCYLTSHTAQNPPQSMRAQLKEKLTVHLDREILLGSTLAGIHKDDIRLTLNGREAKLYASQGQQRSFVLALKLAEGGIAAKCGEAAPVFLLDDVFSELDENRRAFMMEKLTGRQIIVTSCEPGVIPSKYRDADISFRRVENGSVRPLTEAEKDGNEEAAT
ncbi:MAG: DNA replication/repair protein RecF [Ruminococcaceae bacterium]|nr:DNA replication/repair protein RecF [Oscillospiraceae bacterium]